MGKMIAGFALSLLLGVTAVAAERQLIVIPFDEIAFSQPIRRQMANTVCEIAVHRHLRPHSPSIQIFSDDFREQSFFSRLDESLQKASEQGVSVDLIWMASGPLRAWTEW